MPFLSTLSLRRATAVPTLQPWHAANFYPRSPCGERRQTPGEMVCGQNFYPRSPCGERLTNANSPKSDNIISIHALLAESDTASSILMVAPSNFYPRSPCGERLGRLMLVMALSDFYPRSPCGERPVTIWLGYVYLDFYPRSPCGERQGRVLQDITPAGISIHALLAESDCKTCRKSSLRQNFYPRSPCGERPLPSGLQCGSTYFYPRSPCGERHHQNLKKSNVANFYPRSPCGERLFIQQQLRKYKDFYPRSPCGERPRYLRYSSQVRIISIHALLAESDQQFRANFQGDPKFLSTLSLRRATRTACRKSGCAEYFYPRSPCGERRE